MPFIKKRRTANNYVTGKRSTSRGRLQTRSTYDTSAPRLSTKGRHLAEYLKVVSDPFTANPSPMPYLPAYGGLQVTKQTCRFTVVADSSTVAGGFGFVMLKPSFGNDQAMATYSASAAQNVTSLPTFAGPTSSFQTWSGCPFQGSQFLISAGSLTPYDDPVLRGRCVAMAARIYNTTPVAGRGGAVYALNGGAESLKGLSMSTIELLRSRGGVRDGDADGGYTEVAWAPAPMDLHWGCSASPPSYQHYKINANILAGAMNPTPTGGDIGNPDINSNGGRFGFLIEPPENQQQTYICEVVGIFEYSGWSASNLAVTHQSPLHHEDVPNVTRVVAAAHSSANTPRLTTPIIKSSIGRAFSGAMGWLGRQVKGVGKWALGTASSAARNAWNAAEAVAPMIAKDAIIAALG